MTTDTQATPHILPGSIGVRIRLGVLLLLIAVFISLLGIPPMSSLLVTTVLVAITVSGQVLLSWSGFNNLPIGVALVLGVGMLVFLSQVMLASGVPPILSHWGSATTMAFGASWLWRRIARRIPKVLKVQIDQLETAFSIAVFAIAIRQPWLLPFCFSIVLIIWCLRLPPTKTWTLPTGILLVAGGYWLSQLFQFKNWWYYYQSNDAQYFEALGWSTARFGVFEHPGFAGGSIAAYHWLTYAFFGSLSELAGLMPWDALMKIGAPLISFGFASLFIGVTSDWKDSKQAEYWIVATLCVFVMPGIRVDSFAFSMLVGMAFLLAANQAFVRNHQWRTYVLFLVFLPTLFFGKVSTAAVVSLILMFQLVIAKIRRQTFHTGLYLLLIALMAALTLTLSVGNASGQDVTTFSPSLSASLTVLRNLLDTPSFMLQFCLWLVIALNSRKRITSEPNNLYLAVLLATPLLILGWILQAGSRSSFFGEPGIYILTLVLVSRFELRLGRTFSRKCAIYALLLFAGAGLIGFGLPTLLTRLNSRRDVSEWIGDYFWEIVRGTSFTLVISLLVLVLSAARKRPSALLATMLCIALMGFTVGSNLDNFRRIHAVGPSAYENWESNSSAFANVDIRKTGQWVRENTKSDVVLASNNFCCAGIDWWTDAISDLSAYAALPPTETHWGGANYLLPAESQRRFLIQGLRFQIHLSTRDLQEQTRRMTVSLQFANLPSQLDLLTLKGYGVSGFIVNLSLTEHRDWSAFAVEKFRSGDFIYLELKQSETPQYGST
jgi:hypothetical protein